MAGRLTKVVVPTKIVWLQAVAIKFVPAVLRKLLVSTKNATMLKTTASNVAA